MKYKVELEEAIKRMEYKSEVCAGKEKEFYKNISEWLKSLHTKNKVICSKHDCKYNSCSKCMKEKIYLGQGTCENMEVENVKEINK